MILRVGIHIRIGEISERTFCKDLARSGSQNVVTKEERFSMGFASVQHSLWTIALAARAVKTFLGKSLGNRQVEFIVRKLCYLRLLNSRVS